MKTLWLLGILGACHTVLSSSQPPSSCEVIQEALRDHSEACRCYENALVGKYEEKDPDGNVRWIGCTRNSVLDVGKALSALPENTRVHKLWIWDSLIPMIPEGFFDKIRPRNLVLESSNLGRLKNLAPLGDRLKSLELKNNIIKKIDEDLFSSFPGIRHLDLSGNQIETINATSFGNLTHLKTLSLADNNIVSIGDSCFGKLRNLKRLNLAGNGLRRISKEDFRGLTSVEHINLEGNQISDIEHGAFDSLKHLKSLNLGRNPISALSLHDLPALEKLLLSNDSFRSLKDLRFKGLPNLQIISLDQNLLTEIGSRSFNSLPNLRSLSIASNRIQRLSVGAFKGLGRLSTLSLQNNRLQRLPEKVFFPLVHLERLYLSSNSISALSERALYGLTQLRVLSISRNRIERIHPRAFSFARQQLERLHLGHNLLSHLPSSVFEFSPSLQRIDLSSNPWNCDCELVWLSSWLQGRKEQLVNEETTLCRSTKPHALIEFSKSPAAEACPSPRQATDDMDLEGPSSWVTVVGVVLGVVSVLILAAVTLLCAQENSRNAQHRHASGVKTISIRGEPDPIGTSCFRVLGSRGTGVNRSYDLRRVPSDMVTLIPKCSTAVEKRVRFDLCS